MVFEAADTADHRKTPIELTYSSISSTARLYTSTLETIEKLGKNNLDFWACILHGATNVLRVKEKVEC